MDAFADLYSKTLGEEAQLKERLKEINNELSQKYIPQDDTCFLIYANQPESYQGDLMVKPYVIVRRKEFYKPFWLLSTSTQYMLLLDLWIIIRSTRV